MDQFIAIDADFQAFLGQQRDVAEEVGWISQLSHGFWETMLILRGCGSFQGIHQLKMAWEFRLAQSHGFMSFNGEVGGLDKETQ